jgi:hypothetical protein
MQFLKIETTTHGCVGMAHKGIPSFESMEHESKVATWKKMKNCHM